MGCSWKLENGTTPVLSVALSPLHPQALSCPTPFLLGSNAPVTALSGAPRRFAMNSTTATVDDAWHLKMTPPLPFLPSLPDRPSNSLSPPATGSGREKRPTRRTPTLHPEPLLPRSATRLPPKPSHYWWNCSDAISCGHRAALRHHPPAHHHYHRYRRHLHHRHRHCRQG